MKLFRHTLQLAAVALTLVGVFYLRGHAERWCPFGGVEMLYAYVYEGSTLCSLGVSNLYILGGVLLAALLLKRAFCGYLCPLGAISEGLGGVGRRLGLPRLSLTGGADRVLGLLKYGVLIVILALTWRAGELIFRGFDPCYALLSRHGTDITYWAYITAGALALGSLLVSLPLCRWLCPLAAVLDPFSRVAVTAVRRDAQACTGCGRCSSVCPMAIPVDRLATVTRAACTSCLNCVAACPPRQRALRWGPPGQRAWPGALVGIAVVLCTGAAVGASYPLPLPSFVHERGTPPGQRGAVTFDVAGVTCRHSTEVFAAYLQRGDEFEIPGYLRLEVWPAPQQSTVRISFDAERSSPAGVRAAIEEPVFDPATGVWRFSPYKVVD